MTILPALHHRRFALFWIGLLIAWMGNQILTWAIPWQIRSITDSPFALGSIGLIRLAPTVFISLFAGLIADRFNRRKVVMITQSIMGGTALILGLLTITGTIKLWHIYGLLFVHATAFTIDLPARYGLTPNLVPGKALPNALSLEMMAFQIGGIVGPILNGVILNFSGEHLSYFVSAALFAVLVLTLLVMGTIPQEQLDESSGSMNWQAVKEGIQFTFSQPLILSAMVLDFLATFLTRSDSLLPYFARDILNVEGLAYGLLTAAPMIGAVVAGLILSLLGTIRNQGKLVISSVTLIGLAAIVFGLSRNPMLSFCALLLAGVGDSISSILRSAIRQTQTPDRLRGRMLSVNQIFFMGGPYLGDAKSGYLGGLIGVPLAVTLGGIVCIFSVGWVSNRWPELWTYQGNKNN